MLNTLIREFSLFDKPQVVKNSTGNDLDNGWEAIFGLRVGSGSALGFTTPDRELSPGFDNTYTI